MAVLPQLPTYYYHDNFLHLVDQASRLYRDLLSDAESDFVDDFLLLPANAQQLYIRLLCRKGELFRFDKLNYPEIKQIDQAAEILCQQQFSCWLSCENPGDFAVEDILKLFTKPELISQLLAADPKLKKSQLAKMSRQQLDAYCEEHWSLIIGTLLNFPLLGIYGELEFTTLRLLYFGNLYQDFSDFVLRDLGIYRYENYRLDQTSRGFANRQQIEAHLVYYRLQENLTDLKFYVADELLQLDHSLTELLEAAEDIDDKRLQRKVDVRRFELARQLERLAEFDSALEIYGQCQQHPARERRCRIYFNQKNFMACAEVCLAIWQQPYSERERQFVIVFIPRLIKTLQKISDDDCEYWLSQCSQIREQQKTIEEIHLLAERDQFWLEQGVESAALAALKQYRSGKRDPGNGYYVENSLVNSVFGLFYWSVIFAEVPGAFYHGFQYKPDDLYEHDFLNKRRDPFERLNNILDSENNQSEFKVMIDKTISNKFGIANPFVFWNLMDEDYLQVLSQALDRIPLADWETLFEFLWKDVKNHRSGLPDLIWFPQRGGYELIEVKGPGDVLQKNQLAWLEYFSDNNIPASVLYLKEQK